METFVLRTIYQNEEVDVYKDIAYDKYVFLEDIHQTIVNAFGIESDIEISFSLCDEDWNVVEEYQIDDVVEMTIADLIYKKGQRLLYKNGFSEWTFELELIDIYETEHKVEVPVVLESYGIIPDTAPSDVHNPDTFLHNNTYGRYNDSRTSTEDSDDEDEDTIDPNDVDINDFF
ncbi:MAG: IS1096 element passenger TnpR family protein [Flavobacteriales bacterium]